MQRQLGLVLERSVTTRGIKADTDDYRTELQPSFDSQWFASIDTSKFPGPVSDA